MIKNFIKKAFANQQRHQPAHLLERCVREERDLAARLTSIFENLPQGTAADGVENILGDGRKRLAELARLNGGLAANMNERAPVTDAPIKIRQDFCQAIDMLYGIWCDYHELFHSESQQNRRSLWKQLRNNTRSSHRRLSDIAARCGTG